jgi:hypothetical protein
MRTTRSASVLIAVALATVLAACAGGSSAPILSTVGNALPAASAAAAVGEGTGQSAASAAPAPADGVGAAVDDAKIIRTGTIDLEVRDVSVALRTARDGIRALGGYVGASNTSTARRRRSSPSRPRRSR